MPSELKVQTVIYRTFNLVREGRRCFILDPVGQYCTTARSIYEAMTMVDEVWSCFVFDGQSFAMVTDPPEWFAAFLQRAHG